ncbi:hypothetical protein J6590_060030 [Homalodisca vitripennis]|nr:hypothetical protein J6590_060030 [Homalodisca vitripennis]
MTIQRIVENVQSIVQTARRLWTHRYCGQDIVTVCSAPRNDALTTVPLRILETMTLTKRRNEERYYSGPISEHLADPKGVRGLAFQQKGVCNRSDYNTTSKIISDCTACRTILCLKVIFDDGRIVNNSKNELKRKPKSQYGFKKFISHEPIITKGPIPVPLPLYFRHLVLASRHDCHWLVPLVSRRWLVDE